MDFHIGSVNNLDRYFVRFQICIIVAISTDVILLCLYMYVLYFVAKKQNTTLFQGMFEVEHCIPSRYEKVTLSFCINIFSCEKFPWSNNLTRCRCWTGILKLT